jgi:signal transduction histidine kinase
MSLRLRIYVMVVTLVAAALLVLHVPPARSPDWIHYGLWTLLCVGAELLWLPTLSKEATVSMASTVNLATLILWGRGPAMVVVGASTVIASVLFQKKPPIRTLFNAAQIVITMWAVGWAVELLGIPAGGLGPLGRLAPSQSGAFRIVLVMLAAFVVYATVNRSLVTVAVAWSTERPFLRALREDWMFRERFVNDLALFFLSPLMVFAYGTVGYVGLLLFFAPLQMTYETHKRYLELRDAQNQLIHTERMAAKGEMAAGIGHELGNLLVGITNRAQLLLRDARAGRFEEIERHAQLIIDSSRSVASMSKGLMEFSNAEIRVERIDVNALIERAVEFVRPQNRFDGVEWEMRLAGNVPALRADPGQVQQVLINLLVNAAEAMAENDGKHHKMLTVASDYDERARTVRLQVQDSGSGIPPKVLPRIFEPHFTTKAEGHGFGLATSYRIVTNHGGRIVAESLPGRGARFTVTLPVHGPGGWAA